jgi:hypothetical protein
LTTVSRSTVSAKAAPSIGGAGAGAGSGSACSLPRPAVVLELLQTCPQVGHLGACDLPLVGPRPAAADGDPEQEQAQHRHPADGEPQGLVTGHSHRPYRPRMSRRMRSQRSLTAASAPNDVGW